MMTEGDEGFRSIYGLIILVRKCLDQWLPHPRHMLGWVKKKENVLKKSQRKDEKKIKLDFLIHYIYEGQK